MPEGGRGHEGVADFDDQPFVLVLDFQFADAFGVFMDIGQQLTHDQDDIVGNGRAFPASDVLYDGVTNTADLRGLHIQA
ncbi:hypothetical protein GCM10010387_09090 [Streptomyces inusitatus]|uniref:Uncharacterized protein n=1 Tax=Streptomyces inusitatus TaxID=68221 RepID=A0A918PQC4_9ACTN|nr:hypothetical protein GCM10010387_09090 [Streptomyces inusitatus]